MLSNLFEDKNPHQLAWFTSDWKKVSELVSDYQGVEKTNLFDIIEQLTFSKKQITPEQLEVYNKWFINNALSQNVDCLYYVDQMNLYGDKLTNEQHYNYYRLSLRKQIRKPKWAKVSFDVKVEAYKLLLSKRFCINKADAEVYYWILKNKNQLNNIDLIQFKDSVDFKGISKTNQDKKIINDLLESL